MATRTKAPAANGNGRKFADVVEADDPGGAAPEAAGSGKVVAITRVNVGAIRVRIRGTTPLIVRAWDQKTAQMLADKQMGKKAPKSRKAEVPEEVFNGARYISTEGWDGIPASAFKAAMVEAVSTLDVPVREFNMTLAKKTIFVESDGIDRASGRELVRIHGEPEIFALMQPTSGGGPYMSYRPRYRDWEATLNIRYNPLKIDGEGVLNLLTAAGYFVGVGEHRPSAKESRTGTSGLWRVESAEVEV